MTVKTENKQVDIHGAAAHIKRSPRTIRNWIALGNHPKYEKIRGKLFFWTHDLDAFLEAGKEVHEANIRDWNRKAS